MAATPENAKKKLHRLEDQLRSVDKDIKEFKEIFSEFGQENLVKKIKRLRLPEYLVFNMEILAKCCMLEWMKDLKNSCLNIRNMLKTLNGPLIEDVCGVIWVV